MDSQLKDSAASNSFHRRHSSGNERKFPTLPIKDQLSLIRNFSMTTSHEIIESWTWGNRPSEEKLRNCLQLICQEQQKICGDAAGTTLYSYRFRQRATVLKRYYIAQCRNQNWNNLVQEQHENEEMQNDNLEENVKDLALKNKMTKKQDLRFQPHPQGLARLGSRAALSFAFAFLRRAWRNGEDSDLCTDLLQVN